MARREVQEPERGQHRQAAGEAHRVVETEQPAENLRKSEGEPVIEGRILQPGFACDARHHPVAREVHLLHDLDREDVKGAPRVVAEQARRDERQRDQEEYCVRGR